MKMIRNGYQDYEYLKLATQAGHGAEAKSIATSVYQTTHDAGPGAFAIETARAQLANMIAPGRSALTYPGRHLTRPAAANGYLTEYGGLPVARFAGSNNQTSVQVGWDAQNL